MENEREEEERVWSSNELLHRDSNNYKYKKSETHSSTGMWI